MGALGALARGPGIRLRLPFTGAFITYLEARASEPCGTTVLKSAQAALRFMEGLGKIPLAEQVSMAQIVSAAVQELTAGLAGQRGRETRQANYIPVKLARAWESAIVDDPDHRLHPKKSHMRHKNHSCSFFTC